MFASYENATMNSHLEEILTELKRGRGIDFKGYRPGTLQRRLANRMAKLRLTDPKTYLRKLKTDPAEVDRLIDTIGVNVSCFFRDPIVFEILAQIVLPEIIERKKTNGTKEIRIWSAGCAAGEEAYSAAILLHQALKKELPNWQTYIFASDINTGALKQAVSGKYPREKFSNTKLGVLDEYFRPVDKGYEVLPFVQKMVHFCNDDLTSSKRITPAESIYGTFDLVLCRNVLIYLEAELQARIFEKLNRSLESSGYLVLGPSESLPQQFASKAVSVDQQNQIWRKINKIQQTF
jgi:chemotaxis methyl-accepting protein methylase